MSPPHRIALPAPHLLATGFVTLVLLPGLAGCGGDDDKASTEPATTSTTPTTAAPNVKGHGTKNFGANAEGEVELDDNYFSPTTIQGRPGQTLRLELKNEGNAEHNLTLSDQNIDQDVEAGEDAKVSVKVPESGKIEFFCEYHEAAGMAGSLEASGSSSGGSGSGSSGSGSSGGGTTTGSDDSSGGYGY